MAFLLALLLFQAPGDGWTVTAAPAGEVKRVYWDLFQTTEVFVRLIPKDRDGKPPKVNLVFQAFFPGRAKRDPYSGLPQWPRGKAERLAVRALPLPLTMIRDLSLRLDIDGDTVDLTEAGSHYGYLGCPPGAWDCSPNGIEAEIEPSLLESLTTAHGIKGQVLGFPIELSEADELAVREFAKRIGLSAGKTNK